MLILHVGQLIIISLAGNALMARERVHARLIYDEKRYRLTSTFPEASRIFTLYAMPFNASGFPQVSDVGANRPVLRFVRIYLEPLVDLGKKVS
jgi:hypothetical protein